MACLLACVCSLANLIRLILGIVWAAHLFVALVLVMVNEEKQRRGGGRSEKCRVKEQQIRQQHWKSQNNDDNTTERFRFSLSFSSSADHKKALSKLTIGALSTHELIKGFTN